MTVINTNVSALRAQNNSRVASNMQSQAMERLSSGKRINAAKDDAAGLAIATRMDAAARGLTQNVAFLGYLDRRQQLPACYAAADAFVFASRTETQGLVLLEAMSTGLPVVALAEMGTVDILAPGRGGLVPEDNPYVFAQALIRLLNDETLRRRLSAEACTYAAEWSSDALAGRMAALYRQIVAESTGEMTFGYPLVPR